jgi:hypothetical protein
MTLDIATEQVDIITERVDPIAVRGFTRSFRVATR